MLEINSYSTDPIMRQLPVGKVSKVSRYIKLIKRIVKKIGIFIPRVAIFKFILYLEWLEGKSIKAIVLTQQHH